LAQILKSTKIIEESSLLKDEIQNKIAKQEEELKVQEAR
jgi:hypothetical protein